MRYKHAKGEGGEMEGRKARAYARPFVVLQTHGSAPAAAGLGASVLRLSWPGQVGVEGVEVSGP